MTKYELVVVLDPNKTEEEQQAVLAKVDEVITSNGATIEKRDAWGKRRLAYSIRKRREGYYVLIQFDADPVGTALSELNRHLRISEDVLRFLITRAVVGKSLGKSPSELEGRGQYRGRPAYSRDRDSRPDREAVAPNSGVNEEEKVEAQVEALEPDGEELSSPSESTTS